MRISDFSNEMVVDGHCKLLYRPIYLQILEIEGIDLVTFEQERGIDAQLPFDLKVQKAWKVMNFYRKHVGLSPVLFQQKAEDMTLLYQKGYLELQSALVSSRVSFWIALGGAAALEEYTSEELGHELRKWMLENCNPES